MLRLNKMINTPYFPDIKIYVMNLPERVDRKKHMKELLTKIGANPTNIIFNSENFHNIPYIRKEDVIDREKLFKENKLTLSGSNKLNNPYVANALGQLDYIKVIAQSGSMGIILEDDIDTLINYKQIGYILEKSIKELPPDADMLYLEMCYENCGKIKKISENLYKLHSPACTAAILYTAKGAKKVLKLCSPVFDGIDIMFPILIKQKKINAYGIGSMLFFQDAYFGSNAERIFENNNNKHKIRVPLCKSELMILSSYVWDGLSKYKYVFLILSILLIVLIKLLKRNIL
jgi:GR25 family glycosyltransferase involved in LPS biosynthesis